MNCFRSALFLACFSLFSVWGRSQTVREVFPFPSTTPSYGATVSVVQGRDAKLYGTTGGGSQSTSTPGSIFNTSTGGQSSILHDFDGTDGETPQAGLTLAGDGNYYGTTTGGGVSSAGVLFKVTPTESTLWFTSSPMVRTGDRQRLLLSKPQTGTYTAQPQSEAQAAAEQFTGTAPDPVHSTQFSVLIRTDQKVTLFWLR